VETLTRLAHLDADAIEALRAAKVI